MSGGEELNRWARAQSRTMANDDASKSKSAIASAAARARASGDASTESSASEKRRRPSARIRLAAVSPNSVGDAHRLAFLQIEHAPPRHMPLGPP